MFPIDYGPGVAMLALASVAFMATLGVIIFARAGRCPKARLKLGQWVVLVLTACCVVFGVQSVGRRQTAIEVCQQTIASATEIRVQRMDRNGMVFGGEAVVLDVDSIVSARSSLKSAKAFTWNHDIASESFRFFIISPDHRESRCFIWLERLSRPSGRVAVVTAVVDDGESGWTETIGPWACPAFDAWFTQVVLPRLSVAK